MTDSAPQDERREHASDSRRKPGLECEIFGDDYRPEGSRGEAAEREARHSAPATMTVAHEAALRMLGITPLR